MGQSVQRYLLLALLAIACFAYIYGDFSTVLPFTTLFPLYLRVVFLIVLGLWLWGLNLQILENSGLEPFSLIHSDSSSRSIVSVKNFDASNSGSWGLTSTTPIHYSSIYKIASIYTVVFAVAFLFHVKSIGTEDANGPDILPTVTYGALLLVLLSPLNVCFRAERIRFLRSIRRIVFPESFRIETHFSDVILGDIFTSYGKVFGDLAVVFMQVALPAMVSKGSPSATVKFFSSILISLPSLWRLRQCISDFLYISSKSVVGTPGKSKSLPLANAAKYSSSLPVIYLGYLLSLEEIALASAKGKAKTAIQANVNQLLDVWIFFAVVNSLFTLYWDIVHDWGLGRISPPYTSNSPFLLRERNTLFFSKTYLYYGMIILDLCLRFAWYFSIPGVQDRMGGADVTFIMQILEIFRRWVWIFGRFEKQHWSVTAHK